MNDALEATVFADLSNLEQTLLADPKGDRARRLIAYFEEVEKTTAASLASAKDANDRRQVTQLVEGLQATQRVVRQVWESLNEAVLVG